MAITLPVFKLGSSDFAWGQVYLIPTDNHNDNDDYDDYDNNDNDNEKL